MDAGVTTIAYCNGVIAYDSRSCRGTTIIDDDFDKRMEHEGVSFFITGAICDASKLIAAYFVGESPAGSQIECSALVVADGQLKLIGVDSDTGLWIENLQLNKPYCIGSGSHHAWTALDMGCSAYKAVELASRRDVGTGGRIRTYQVAKPE